MFKNFRRAFQQQKLEQKLIFTFEHFTRDIFAQLLELNESPLLLKAIVLTDQFREICSEVGKDTKKYQGLTKFLGFVREKDREIEKLIDKMKAKHKFSDPHKFRVEISPNAYDLRYILSQLNNIYQDFIERYQLVIEKEGITPEITPPMEIETTKQIETIISPTPSKISPWEQIEAIEKAGESPPFYLKFQGWIYDRMHPEEIPENKNAIQQFRAQMTDIQMSTVKYTPNFKDELQILGDTVDRLKELLDSYEKVGYYNHVKRLGSVWLQTMEQLGKSIQERLFDPKDKTKYLSTLRNHYRQLDEWLARVDVKYRSPKNLNPKEGNVDPAIESQISGLYQDLRSSLIESQENIRILEILASLKKEQEKIQKETQKAQEITQKTPIQDAVQVEIKPTPIDIGESVQKVETSEAQQMDESSSEIRIKLNTLDEDYRFRLTQIRSDTKLTVEEQSEEVLALSRWKAQQDIAIFASDTAQPSHEQEDTINVIELEQRRKNEEQQAMMEAKAKKPRLVALKTSEIDQIWEFYFLHQIHHPTPEEFYGGARAEQFIRRMLQQAQEIYSKLTPNALFSETLPGSTRLYFVGDCTFAETDQLLSQFFQPKIFESQATEHPLRIVFLGNYLGHSSMDLHNFLYLLCFNLAYPREVILLRGEQETEERLIKNNFNTTILQYFNQDLLEEFHELFVKLPSAYALSSKYKNVFAVHGGIPIDPSDPPSALSIDPKALQPHISYKQMDPISRQFINNHPNFKLKKNSYRALPQKAGYEFNHKLFEESLRINQISTDSIPGIVVSSGIPLKDGGVNYWKNLLYLVYSINESTETTTTAQILEIEYPADPEYPEDEYEDDTEEEDIEEEDIEGEYEEIDEEEAGDDIETQQSDEQTGDEGENDEETNEEQENESGVRITFLKIDTLRA